MNIKEVHPVLLLTLSVVVFATGFIGAPYIFAQTASIYYCKSLTDTIANPDTRYFQCSTNSSFSVSAATAPYNCEISADEPFCKNLTVPAAISTTLGKTYCNPKGWGYSPSPSVPSSNFTCSTPSSSPGAFDFSLSKPGDKSVVQGSSVSNTITTTLTAGTPTPVTFSVSGLPPDSSASFSPASASCTPPCTPVINILTSTTTPPGTYPVTIVGISEAVNPGFPDQNTTAFGHCSFRTTSFYGVINITNSSSNDVRFSRTSFTTPTLPGITGSSPSSFIVPAGSTLGKGGFGNITYSDSDCMIVVPSNNVLDGSATYKVERVDNGALVASEVIYSWDYTH
ncbi:MAG: Ig family protein [Parcubacteria group bacterium GW2011_GWB1_36_5]|nr:MAG: Ig family protein [Parcubacteria group bacterium GW2011_GWB1_36_5]